MEPSEISYVCECGYAHANDEMHIKRIWDNTKKQTTQHKVCIEHGARIKSIKTFCIDCGVAVFSTAPNGHVRVRCDLHKKIRKRAIQSKHSKKQATMVKLLRDEARLEAKPKKKLADHYCPMFSTVCGTCVYPAFPCAVSQSKQAMAAA